MTDYDDPDLEPSPYGFRSTMTHGRRAGARDLAKMAHRDRNAAQNEADLAAYTARGAIRVLSDPEPQFTWLCGNPRCRRCVWRPTNATHYQGEE